MSIEGPLCPSASSQCNKGCRTKQHIPWIQRRRNSRADAPPQGRSSLGDVGYRCCHPQWPMRFPIGPPDHL